MYQKAMNIIQKELDSAEDYEKLTLKEIFQAFEKVLNVDDITHYPGVMDHITGFITETKTYNKDYHGSLYYLAHNIMRDCEAGIFMCPVCEQLYPMERYNTTDDPLDEFCIDCQEAGAGS